MTAPPEVVHGEAGAPDPPDRPDPPGRATARRPARWRSVVAVLLVVAAAVLAPLTVTARWVHDRILDTDGYVETVGPLADDPAVTDALATRVVDELFAVADVQERITDVLPGPVNALGRTFTSSLRAFATEQTERVLESDAFAQAWERANRVAHEQVVAMFSGEDDAVTEDDGRVVLDLGVVADRVRERLVDEGVGILRRVSIPEGAIEVTLFESDLVPRLQTLFRVLDTLAVVLPIAFVVAALGAVIVAHHRRRTVIALGLAVAGAAALVPVALDLGRRVTVSEASSASLDTDATKAVYDTLTVALRDWAWLLVALGLFVALVAVVSDPRLVGAVVGRLGRTRPGERPVRVVGTWVRARRAWLLVGTIAGALVVLLVWPTPTLLVLAGVVLVAALLGATVLALARVGAPSPASGAGSALERSDHT